MLTRMAMFGCIFPIILTPIQPVMWQSTALLWRRCWAVRYVPGKTFIIGMPFAPTIAQRISNSFSWVSTKGVCSVLIATGDSLFANIAVKRLAQEVMAL